jgi:hypothetical protein
MSELHAQILEIFLSSREQRDAPYDEKNFMEFLILPNGKVLRKSFKGSRYFGRFVERIEEECCVYFPQSFYDKEWNLSDFVAYIEKRKQKPGVDLRMAIDNLASDKWHYGLMLLILFFPITALLLVSTIYALFKLGVGIAFVMLALLVGINWVHATVLGQMFHLKRLIAKLTVETAKRNSGKRKTTTPSSAEANEALF